MKTAALLFLRGFAAAGILMAGPAPAAFDGPYSVTPPDPGVYTYSGPPIFTFTFGSWSVARASVMRVDTSNAPASLVLETTAISAFGSVLEFRTLAAADGVVSFESSAVSSFVGAI